MKIAVLTLVLAACLPLSAQWKQKPTTGSSPERVPDRTVLQGQVATSVDFGARLVEPDKFVKQGTAMVQASIEGLELVDPNTHPTANEHQGHIVYKVDNGPEQTATATRFEVHGLSPGNHTITVYLAGNDNCEISPEHKLKVQVPKQ